ncbi:hypothetical protein AVEN_200974-1 [Araneus ventricosus]|uniref:Uncharacterized protein n=1 Tax=Araneus ventricosus TaxID=182803 RepID=A0A4Y2TR57_ARAVE|nr:hypothetical protein AVEN_200974-1 [Araneus ventricosus]
MSDEKIKPIIDSAVCEELRKVNNFATRATVYLRVLKRIADLMEIPWNIIPEIKNMIYLEPEIIKLIEACWYSQIINESNEDLERFISRDYVKTTDMLKFINTLQRRETKQTEPLLYKIYEILGMDGFLGDDTKRYIEYLKYPSNDFKGVHVRAVRKLYKRIKDLDEINKILVISYGWKDAENMEELEMKDEYLSFVGDHRDEIIEWKKQQVQESLSDHLKTKRKNTEETETKKSIKRPRKNNSSKKSVETDTNNSNEHSSEDDL